MVSNNIRFVKYNLSELLITCSSMILKIRFVDIMLNITWCPNPISNLYNRTCRVELKKIDLSVLQPFIKCACPVYPLHIHSITSFIHLHVSIQQYIYVSKLRHFPDSLSLAYMYKIYLHFIEKSNSLNESPMEGNTFRFIYVKNFYKCLFNSTQWNQLIKKLNTGCWNLGKGSLDMQEY